MTTVPEPQALLLLPRLRVQNANAISSPLTWGFPAATAFTGFVHALQRRASERYPLALDGVGIVCHRFEPQVSQPAGKRTYVFNLTRNPVDKDGSTTAIVEEGRIHLEISLLIGVRGEPLHDGSNRDEICQYLYELASGMRLAGGSVLPAVAASPRHQPQLKNWPALHDDQRALSRQLASRLLPGFALVSRETLLQNHLEAMRNETPSVSALDALLDLVRLNIDPQAKDEKLAAENDVTEDVVPPVTAASRWHTRPKSGWLVPIPAGYASISPLYAAGTVRNARDREVPFRFVESLFTVGEWLSPHRVRDIRQLLWYHQADASAGLYRCTTPFYSPETLA